MKNTTNKMTNDLNVSIHLYPKNNLIKGFYVLNVTHYITKRGEITTNDVRLYRMTSIGMYEIKVENKISYFKKLEITGKFKISKHVGIYDGIIDGFKYF